MRLGADGGRGMTVDGQPAMLTLDPELQRVAERLLALANPYRGAVVMIEVSSGKIRALGYSRRGQAPRPHELFQLEAPAASLFKIVTTSALFENTRVHPKTRVCVSGGEKRIEPEHLLPPGAGSGRCFKFQDTLGFSVNAAYAQLATRHLSQTALLAAGERWGFNADLPLELGATLGKLRVPEGELAFARTAAGFENSTLSPLGAAYLAYVVATQGMRPALHLVESTDTYRAPTHTGFLGRAIKRSTALRLLRMMEVTVHSGTSLAAFTASGGQSHLGDLKVAGKTGTLRSGRLQHVTSWFTGFAPSRDPEVVVAVMLENTPLWRRRANEVARDMLRAYFAGRRGITHPLFQPPDDPAPKAPSAADATASAQ